MSGGTVIHACVPLRRRLQRPGEEQAMHDDAIRDVAADRKHAHDVGILQLERRAIPRHDLRRNKIDDEEMWQLVAYVRTLSNRSQQQNNRSSRAEQRATTE